MKINVPELYEVTPIERLDIWQQKELAKELLQMEKDGKVKLVFAENDHMDA